MRGGRPGSGQARDQQEHVEAQDGERDPHLTRAHHDDDGQVGEYAGHEEQVRPRASEDRRQE